MKKRYLMGFDIGNGHGCCLLLNPESGEIVTAVRKWKHPSAYGYEHWGYELDIPQIWYHLKEAAQEALRKCASDSGDILAISVSSMRHGTVIIDQAGDEILATPNLDSRAASEGMGLAAELGEEIYTLNGHWPLPIYSAARVLWLRENDPRQLDRARALFSISDWAAYRLTGRIIAEHSQAAETLLYDLKSHTWAWKLIKQLNLPEFIFPELVPAGTLVGPLSHTGAELLGLNQGIPVIAGGADTQSGLLGCGVITPGGLGVIAGTTTPVQIAVSQPIVDDQMRLWTGVHLLPELWVLESNVGQTGSALEWFASMQYPNFKEPIRIMNAAAAQSQPGALGMTSTLGATLFNAQAMRMPVTNLTFSPILAQRASHPSHHLSRSVLEGMAYGIQVNIEQLLEVAPDPWQPVICMAGGMANSDLFVQILSDVSGVEINLPPTIEATAMGAAICAAAGTGLFSDLKQAAKTLVNYQKRFSPRPGQHEVYRHLYLNWKELNAAHSQADILAGNIALDAIAHETGPLTSQKTRDFRPRILITAPISEDILREIEQFGEVIYQNYRDEMRLLSGEDLIEALQGFHVLVTEVDIVDLEALQELPDLRVVISCRGNPVNVDIPACTALGIPVLHTPGRNADAVADLTLAFMIMLGRKLIQADQFMHHPGVEAGDMGRMGMAHENFQGQELWRKTIGLIGLGAVGKKLAQRLQPFGARVLAYDPYLSPQSAILDNVELVDLETLLQESDFISLHAAVTSETRNMLSEAQFHKMKQGACLINTARAALLDEQALYQALASGHLGGAALDVFSIEPPGSQHPLLNLPNVIATPHLGGNTFEVAAHQGLIVKEELVRLLKGVRPLYILNHETLTNFDWKAKRLPLTSEQLQMLSQSTVPGVSDLDIESQATKVQLDPTVIQPNKTVYQPNKNMIEFRPTNTKPKAGQPGGVFSKIRDRLVGTEKEKTSMTQESLRNQTVANVQLILVNFLSAVRQDQALIDFSAGREFTMQYYLTDLEKDFYMDFSGGKVEADLGSAQRTPDLTLKMKTDILDGMFTGRINPTRAAMTGKISFSGDTRKAMAMQKIQKDLTRLYSQVREQVGDPGDLASLGGPPMPDQASPPHAHRESAGIPTTPTAPAPTAYQASGDERDELIQVLNELYHAGLITATGGNISARTSDNAEQAWITPSQIFKGSLRPDMMVRIDLQGEAIEDDALPASSERLVHCAIYRRRADVQAVVHSHAPNATIMMLAGIPFQPISTEAAFIGDIPVVPFIMPGTSDLGQAVTDALGDGVAVLMQNHGLVVAASSLRRAADITEVIETTAEKLVMMRLLGVKVPNLPKEIVEELSQYRDLMA